MPLTDTAIKNAKPTSKAFKLYDEKGLFIQVNPNGGKWWRFKYRYETKEKLLSLGVYPDVNLKTARAKRENARKLLDEGIDPSVKRKAEKQSGNSAGENSFELIAREWLASYMKDNAESHKNKVSRRLEMYVYPWIGSKPISEITAPDVLDCVKRVQNLNILETAKRVLQVIGQIFCYAVQTGRALRDVTADLKGALPSPTVKHMAAFTEPEQVAELLRAIDGFKGSFTVQTALRLTPLLFPRPSELRTARWADIDLEAGEWRYIVSKTKTNHLVPLSKQAIKLLSEIKPLSGHGEYVFQGGHDPTRPMSDAAINTALQRMGYNTQTEITAHGFRAIARTLLHERLNYDPHVIEHQLAHIVPDALGGAYNRTKFIEQRKVMMQSWADYLDDLKAGAKVIAFKKA